MSQRSRHSILGLLGPILAMAGAAIVAPAAHGQTGPAPRRLVPAAQLPPSAQLTLVKPAPATQAAGAANPAILLTGYWPPSNEALRRFSPSPVQNPQGWIGQNWENRGYDVYAYFPEFTPPTCSNCGKGTGDLEVDYQDTSADFWPIANALQPIAIITFSRGSINMSWEVEMNQYNRSAWISDFLAPFMPTPNPPDASVPAGTLRPSTLPVNQIVSAVAAAALGLNAFVCFSGDGGGFLSEFIAYHGVWYQSIHASPADPAWCVAAGHIHVGGNIPWATAAIAAQISLRTVIQHVDNVRAATVCQADLGFGGPGGSSLALCGDPLQSGGNADLLLIGVPAASPILFFAGGSIGMATLGQGTFVPSVPLLSFAIPADASGKVFLQGVPGGGGPATAYLQAVYADAALPAGIGLSNALKVDLLP